MDGIWCKPLNSGPPTLIGVLCSPRARSVLMCAASWTEATQPRRLHIQSKSQACRPLGSPMNTQGSHEHQDTESTNKKRSAINPNNQHKIHEEKGNIRVSSCSMSGLIQWLKGFQTRSYFSSLAAAGSRHILAKRPFKKLKCLMFFFFFWLVLNEVMLNWASEGNTLHLSEVAPSSSQRLSSSTSFSNPPPTSILLADVHTKSCSLR